MIRIFLNGCNGRMGRAIAEISQASETFKIVAGGDSHISPTDFPQYTDINNCQEEFDVIIDFSHISATESVIDFARKRNRPLVMCTTGLSVEQKQLLHELSKDVAVFYSANMSLGINVLSALAQKAAELLYPDFDIEIIEAHHNQKLDAPSGTALLLADDINATLDNQLEYVYNRQPLHQKRQKKELGLHAIRGGTIVGEHSVIFAGPQETITLSHSAQSREVFAQGSLSAARFLVTQPAGLYSMKELVQTTFNT